MKMISSKCISEETFMKAIFTLFPECNKHEKKRLKNEFLKKGIVVDEMLKAIVVFSNENSHNISKVTDVLGIFYGWKTKVFASTYVINGFINQLKKSDKKILCVCGDILRSNIKWDLIMRDRDHLNLGMITEIFKSNLSTYHKLHIFSECSSSIKEQICSSYVILHVNDNNSNIFKLFQKTKFTGVVCKSTSDGLERNCTSYNKMLWYNHETNKWEQNNSLSLHEFLHFQRICTCRCMCTECKFDPCEKRYSERVKFFIKKYC